MHFYNIHHTGKYTAILNIKIYQCKTLKNRVFKEKKVLKT